MSLLELHGVDVCYGEIQVLDSITMHVEEQEIVTIIGANSAGKTTLNRTISGLLPVTSGTIEFDGKPIHSLPPHDVVEAGIVHIPEGRRIFPLMTIEENLMIGAHTPRAYPHIQKSLVEVYDLFPRLAERKKQLGRTLSGGEQQMLAIARGLMAKPRLLILDEPSLGLAPILVQEVFKFIPKILEQNIPIMLVEQNVKHSLQLCHRGYILENGRIINHGEGCHLLENADIRKAYLGA